MIVKWIKEEPEFPLYSASNLGRIWDEDVCYYMCEIIKWSGRTKDSKALGQKTVYVSSLEYLQAFVDKEAWCAEMYERCKDFEKIIVQAV